MVRRVYPYHTMDQVLTKYILYRVENILTGLSEQSKVLYSSPKFLILPDMKWDLQTLSSLYLMALVQDRTIRSLRDLRRHHVGLLKSIQHEAHRIVQEKWNLGPGSLRMYIHYQPSYCMQLIPTSPWFAAKLLTL
jgi:m7GpppX diphosphatase